MGRQGGTVGGRLKGKVAFISGGASGLGAACAAGFVSEGAVVVVGDISVDAKRRENRDSSPALHHRHLDVTDEIAWEGALREVVAEFGQLDILVNAAGISLENDNLEDCTPETWERTLAVNLDGVFLGCKHAVRTMRPFGRGSIVNFASILGKVGDGGSIAYTASKAAVRLLTRSTALYCAKEGLGIRCNAVCPGYFATPKLHACFADRPKDEMKDLLAAQPSGRFGQPEEITGLIVYLSSDEASSCTGAEFVIDGGYVAA